MGGWMDDRQNKAQLPTLPCRTCILDLNIFYVGVCIDWSARVPNLVTQMYTEL